MTTVLSTQWWLEQVRGGGYIPPSPPPVVVGGPRPQPVPRLGEALRSSEVLRRMVIYPGDRPDLVERFVRGAGDLGKRLGHVLYEEGLRVIIVPRSQKLAEVVLPDGSRLPAGRSQNVSLEYGAAGFYRHAPRQVVLKERYLKDDNVTIHELAHAVDYILSDKCGFRERLSDVLWHGFAGTRKILADGYMMHGPHEYFAVSLEIYYKKKGRQQLERIDPDLLKFLDSFLR